MSSQTRGHTELNSKEGSFFRFLDRHRHRFGNTPDLLASIESTGSLQRLFQQDPFEAIKRLEFSLIRDEAGASDYVGDISRLEDTQQVPLRNPAHVAEALRDLIPSFVRQDRYTPQNMIDVLEFEVGDFNWAEDALGQEIIEDHIMIRRQILEDVADQVAAGATEVDLTKYNYFELGRLVFEYVRAVQHSSDYRLHHHARDLVAEFARGQSQPDVKGIDFHFLGSATGLGELELATLLRAQHIDQMIAQSLVADGQPFHDMYSISLVDQSITPMRFGELIANRVIGNCYMNMMDICSPHFFEVLSADINPDKTSYVTLMNCIINLPEALQVQMLEGFVKLRERHPDKDVRVALDIPLVTDDVSLQTNYDGLGDEVYGNRIAEDVLLLKPHEHSRSVYHKSDSEGNIVIYHGSRANLDIPLLDLMGNPILRGGLQVVIPKHTQFNFFASERLSDAKSSRWSEEYRLARMIHPNGAHALLHNTTLCTPDR